jgi:CDP-diacylglycerol--glycerol-3-phosphate 3-phosphatidyltransferase
VPAGVLVTLYSLKPRFQQLLRPSVAALARAGVTANQVTLAAALGSVLVGAAIAAGAPTRWPFLLLPLWLFLRMALNAVDGMLAREFGQKSRLGAYLNELSDLISDAALYAPFALLSPFGAFWVGCVILLAWLGEFAGVLGPMIGASRRYDGPMGKSDRALGFGALALWVGLGGPLPGWSAVFLMVLAVLIGLTVVNRVRAGLAEANAA